MASALFYTKLMSSIHSMEFEIPETGIKISVIENKTTEILIAHVLFPNYYHFLGEKHIFSMVPSSTEGYLECQLTYKNVSGYPKWNFQTIYEDISEKINNSKKLISMNTCILAKQKISVSHIWFSLTFILSILI